MNLKCWFKSLISIILLKIYFPNVVFRIINKPEEIEKMYNLIWQVYGIEKKYIDPNLFSPQILKDEYDENAIKIGAFNGNNLLGTLRIILPSHRGFYVEKDFNVNLSEFSSREIAELSRLVVLKKYRNELISFGLLKKALEISKRKKIKYWIVVVSEKLKNYFSKSFGVKFYPLKISELTEEQIKIRKKMSNYYKVCNPLPYLVSLEEIY
ncbi:MAG: GNAT family N-acyltransferase [candidate division WOR-3 bacterium]